MRLLHAGFIVGAAVICGCQTQQQTETTMTKKDPHSYAIPSQAKVTHLRWKAAVDFEAKTLAATASWTIDTSHGDTVHFDIKGIRIISVTTDDGKKSEYTIGKSDPVSGEDLAIPVKAGTRTIHIEYNTSPDAEALQWLTPQQTAGKNAPFLFTQSQAILARTWIPCQDTPGVRFTYEAEVTVPKNLLALMSASNPKEKKSDGVYVFEMKQPIPSYLLALAVGDLTFQSISERSGIYAEKVLIDKAAWEFADLEKMITGAESLYGPYRWERYDVLVLPPSFPFGGMENPRLTFATPTILAGDRSLTSLIAHELAHSWSGNLVTNATWNDFWLNEGFTVYFETRIMEKLYGRDYAEMLASLNLQDLHDEIKSLRERNLSADTKLLLDLSGRNPDEGVTDIAYNKGYFFLRAIEEKYGREKFDSFLKDYFSENAFGSMDTEAFQDYITDYYGSRYNTALDKKIFAQWIHTEGLPENVPQPHSEKFAKVDQTLASWRAEKNLDQTIAHAWSTHEWLHFLKNLPEKLSKKQMQELDTFGDFSNSGNAEIITAWGVISIRNDYEKMQPKIEEFLITTGRRKFLSPLYNELVKTEEGKRLARKIYSKARPNYHFVATNTFDKLLAK